MKPASTTTGLRYWMARVLQECDNAAKDFSADPVHDLRVALRRCRSMADGMIAMDPHPDWKAMKKAGRTLFRSLGELRDVQIMMEWIEKLENKSQSVPQAEAAPSTNGTGGEAPKNPAAALLDILNARESEHKHTARAALEKFDRKQWKQWGQSLPQRAGRIRPGSAVFKHLALERWTEARQLHRQAMRSRSQVALHTLRIGIKRFRYIVENFLPEEHERWSDDLKRMQDLLGEVHDLDVLWATALACRVFPDAISRQAWHQRILEERRKRVDEYHSLTSGSGSLWDIWRAGLPQGTQIQALATRRMKLWAKVLDPDFAHSERVAGLALELYDGLTHAGVLGSAAHANGQNRDGRDALYAAALLHDVGLSKGKKKHQKESQDLIEKHGVPLGWSADEMRRAGLVARFHCGALPRRGHKQLRDLLSDEQKLVIRLAAILRLANALDSEHDGRVRRVRVAHPETPARRTNGFLRKPAPLGKNEALVIEAEGYLDSSQTAQAVAAERYLLETIVRRPVMVRPRHVATHRKAAPRQAHM